jgi:hypothetical protein
MRLENKYVNDDKDLFSMTTTNESYQSDWNQTNSDLMMNEKAARRESVKLMIATSLSFWCGIVKVILNVLLRA